MKKSREEVYKHRSIIEEEIEELGEKPLRCPPSGNRSTRQSVGIHGLVRDPPSLIYPLYLSPSSFYSNKASRNRVLSSFPRSRNTLDCICQSLASSNTSQQHQNLIDTQNGCGKCLGYQSLKDLEMEI